MGHVVHDVNLAFRVGSLCGDRWLGVRDRRAPRGNIYTYVSCAVYSVALPYAHFASWAGKGGPCRCRDQHPTARHVQLTVHLGLFLPSSASLPYLNEREHPLLTKVFLMFTHLFRTSRQPLT